MRVLERGVFVLGIGGAARSGGLVLLVAILAPGPAAATGGLQQIEALGGSGHEYHSPSDIDSVNLFNGNLTVRIPLASYAVGAHLSYDFTLYFNSGGAWRKGGAVHQFNAIPDPRSTSGLGWRLSLGDLHRTYAPGSEGDCGFAFITPDGGEHKFFPTLHPWDSGNCSGNYWYTRDGSYFRLHKLDPATERMDVEAPDGRIFEFARYQVNPIAHRLTRIRDRFGHAVNLSYAVANQTLITDTLGRTHRIHWQPGGTQHQHTKPPYITQLDLAGRQGARANYNFQYQVREAGACIGNPQAGDPWWPYWDVPLLQQVSHPNGLENPWQMLSNEACGVLAWLRLPSRGEIRWSYGDWIYPHFPEIVDGSDEWRPTQGVRRRYLFDANGQMLGEWRYTNELNHPEPRWATATKTTVRPPGGAGCTVHHFSAEGPLNPGSHWSYALPFTTAASDTVGGRPLYLSQEVYPSAGPDLCTGAKQRSVYTHYEREGLGGILDANHRRYATRTRYHDDANHWAETRSSDFDGLGHYRVVRRFSNFLPGDTHTERTQFNINGEQTLTVDGNGGKTSTYTHPPTSMPWILGVFSYQQQNEPGRVARQNFSFNHNNGFLQQKRILRVGTQTGAQDVVVNYTRYPDTNVAGRGQVREESWTINGGTPHLRLLHS